jgi:hypothetical protein
MNTFIRKIEHFDLLALAKIKNDIYFGMRLQTGIPDIIDWVRMTGKMWI